METEVFHCERDDQTEFWTKPAMDNIKINVNAALFEKKNSYGFGVVARDTLGRPIHIKDEYYGSLYLVEVVEATSPIQLNLEAAHEQRKSLAQQEENLAAAEGLLAEKCKSKTGEEASLKKTREGAARNRRGRTKPG
uniref:Uncharacterized protein n=1 Tax=Cannabis sativa TaxID=3483 RepID=A0A803QCW0_CANSA